MDTDSKSNGFLVQPLEVGELKKSFPVSVTRFAPPSPKKRSKNNPSTYLVIGFDTEYQRVPGTNDNEVLSYQYACMLVREDNKDKEELWSGIIIPESGKVDDRLRLRDFVSFAIGDGLSQFPNLVIPRDIYLVAHFTRADVPAFIDFKLDVQQSKANLNLENIRNTFVNVSYDIEISLLAKDDPEVIINLKIRDTITLAPTGAKKLEDIGEILKYQKIHLDTSIKQNMKQLRLDDWKLFREYAIRDAEVCAKYTARMIHLYYEMTGTFTLPITLTQIGVDLLMKSWKDKGIDTHDIVGKEEVEEKVWIKKIQQYRTRTSLRDLKLLYYNIPLITECYHGGRNEQYWFGACDKSVWYDYDLSSAYPSAMTLIGYPNWGTITPLRNTQELLDTTSENKFYPVDLVFAEVKFKFPESVRFPCLPVRTNNGLVFPREGFSTTHISEIRVAQSLGCEIELVYGIKMKSERFSKDKRFARPFLDFTRYCIEQRKKYPKKTLENLFWKELANSTYGKTAQGLRERRVYDLRSADTKALPPSRITNPVYAAFITAFCRGMLSEIMNRLPKEILIFSATTDGFLSTATDDQMKAATDTDTVGATLCGYYKDARRKLVGDEIIYEVKHIIRQPLGWRTRGQATLVPSKKTDWKSKKDIPIDNRIVLAKGGIKLPFNFDKSEENVQIVKLFFERFPNQEIDIKTGMGIREMYEEGSDYVDKTITKRLSMEFDWKRKPLLPEEIPVKIKGVNCKKHLRFTSEPWNNIEQFLQIRDMWENYNCTSPHNLKTLKDYQDFSDYVDTQSSTSTGSGSAGTWLRKKDGDLKRLRRDLVIAFQKGRGGCHGIKPNAFGNSKNFTSKTKIKAEVFAKYLTVILGIPVNKTDVDNDRKRGKKTDFTPHQVPRTKKTIEALDKAKKELFPNLDPEQFLSGESPFNIH